VAGATRRSAFTPEVFRFLNELKAHNDREWFLANKARYEKVAQEPMLQFIRDVGQELRRVSSRFVADPRRSGGSMFRIYRDTRFSANKDPYKTWLAARFQHNAAVDGQSVPGFYLRLSPDGSAGGGGIHHPETPRLTRIRTRIANKPEDWRRVRAAVPDIEGDRLKRAPAGFDPSHAFVDDLKLKDYYVMQRFTQRQVTAPDFLDRYVATCRDAAPLVEFLTRALRLPW
jgi:uncharacterized protein (TIGR02453 family)